LLGRLNRSRDIADLWQSQNPLIQPATLQELAKAELANGYRPLRAPNRRLTQVLMAVPRVPWERNTPDPEQAGGQSQAKMLHVHLERMEQRSPHPTAHCVRGW